MIRVYERKAKTVMHRTRLPEADWGINYYHGCTHGCIYCYLRFLCRWRRGEAWGEFVDVKVNAPELVFRESWKKRGTAILCTGGDPYQPVEGKYQLTREVLKNLNKNLKLCVLTKSDMITRDIDLFKEFRECELGLTITTMDMGVKKVFEPFSSPPHKRVDALKWLKEEGFHTYVFIGPILPYLTDLEEILREVSPFVDVFMFEDLNLGPCRREVLSAIKKHFPELDEKYRSLSKDFWLRKEKEIKMLSNLLQAHWFLELNLKIF